MIAFFLRNEHDEFCNFFLQNSSCLKGIVNLAQKYEKHITQYKGMVDELHK